VTVEVVEPALSFRAETRVPGDKSIAHRALILGALADGDSEIHGVPDGEDVQATADCLRALGCQLDAVGPTRRLLGRGVKGWRSPDSALDCKNSGTTMRVLAGALAGSPVSATLAGDSSLSRRPMDRVVEPLRRMGARITAADGRSPLTIDGTELTGYEHDLPGASAQVKTALLLAGLHASGPTSVKEPYPTRDHTERLLTAMGARVSRADGAIRIEPAGESLRPLHLSIPGDLSSAAFLFAAAALRPGWKATVSDVGLNPSRTAILDILRQMGAEVEIQLEDETAVEPRGRVTVRGNGLHAVHLDPAQVAQAIDEIPVLLVVASQAEGVTRVAGASELRLKESDRLATMSEGLRRLGVPVDETADGIAVTGPTALQRARVGSAGDHRVAMAMAVAALVADGPVSIDDARVVSISYPGFFRELGAAAHGGS
jgi:3-phosphoshikimate 1-carboxyvinyltransferase